jgi:hypothetical protein
MASDEGAAEQATAVENKPEVVRVWLAKRWT